VIGVLVSGEGTNLQALIDEGLPIVAVASNQAGAPALERAEAAGVAAAAFELDEFDDREARDAAMADWLTEHGVDLVVCAGYMHLLRRCFLTHFPGRIVNTHSAPLPEFPGAHPIEDVLLSNIRIYSQGGGSEGLGFSLMMSVRNVMLFGSDWMGSKLLETYHLQFNSLVLANAATSALAIPLVLLLPALIVATTDAQGTNNPAELSTAPAHAAAKSLALTRGVKPPSR
jgi:hypothetical protein